MQRKRVIVLVVLGVLASALIGPRILRELRSNVPANKGISSEVQNSNANGRADVVKSPAYEVPNQSPKDGYETQIPRLHQVYQNLLTAHPALTNLYDRLSVLALRDPFASDLFSDACLFISIRSSIQEMGDAEEREYSEMKVRWAKKTNADPAKVEALLHRHEESLHSQAQIYNQLLDVVSKTYAARFTKKHGLDGEATVAQILELGLPPGLKMPVEIPCP